VFQPTANGERTPDNRLLVDVIHQAVRRIKAGDGDEPAAAPQVVVINLSLADEKRPFARIMSPLGRLLDYLSWRYSVLFLVSAGNITDRLRIEGYATWGAFEDATPEDREKAVFASLNAQKSQRTLLSPAEAMNALTIGAAHSGSAFNGAHPAGRIDPFTTDDVANIISAMGLGFKKVVKPELLFSGGRAPVTMVASGDQLEVMPVRAGARYFRREQSITRISLGVRARPQRLRRAPRTVFTMLSWTVPEARCMRTPVRNSFPFCSKRC
jgi:hypothetical protein